MDLPGLVGSKKQIVTFSGWSPPEPETNYMTCVATLQVAGLMEKGFNLEGGCYADRPDEHVTFELALSS